MPKEGLKNYEIFTSFIFNAIKYAQAGSEIELDISHKNEHLLLQLTDQGIGISEEDQKLIFEPF